MDAHPLARPDSGAGGVLAAGVVAAVRASRADSTRRVYDCYTRQWADWCAARGVSAQGRDHWRDNRTRGGVTVGVITGREGRDPIGDTPPNPSPTPLPAPTKGAMAERGLGGRKNKHPGA